MTGVTGVGKGDGVEKGDRVDKRWKGWRWKVEKDDRSDGLGEKKRDGIGKGSKGSYFLLFLSISIESQFVWLPIICELGPPFSAWWQLPRSVARTPYSERDAHLDADQKTDPALNFFLAQWGGGGHWPLEYQWSGFWKWWYLQTRILQIKIILYYIILFSVGWLLWWWCPC